MNIFINLVYGWITIGILTGLFLQKGFQHYMVIAEKDLITKGEEPPPRWFVNTIYILFFVIMGPIITIRVLMGHTPKNG